MGEVEEKLRAELAGAVERKNADTLLLSGGLDSSSLAAVGNVDTAITVDFEDKGSDPEFASEVAELHNIDWELLNVSEKEAIDILNELVLRRESFDPGLFNDVPVYRGMSYAGQHSERVMTGDAGDYLFLGYSFLWDEGEPNEYVRELLDHLEFASEEFGELFGLDVKQPYMDDRLAEFSLSIDPDLKIKYREGYGAGDVAVTGSGEERWGKWILREAMEEKLPNDVIFRPKTDLEYGSGFTSLRDHLRDLYSESDIKDIQNDYGVELFDGSHVFLFELFIDEFGKPPDNTGDEYCGNCGYENPPERSHCDTCGFYSEED